MARRSFGQIVTRPPRPGYYVQFQWQGKRVRRSVGPKKAAAQKKLAEAEALLRNGIELGEVLAEIFGDFHGSRLTFRTAAPLYLQYAKGRKKESTLKNDVPRLRVLCRAPWADKPLGRIRPEDLLPWMAKRQESRKVKVEKRVRGEDGRMRTEEVEKMVPGASGATINRDLALASAVFRWAIQAGYVDDNPVRRVDRFSEKGRRRETYLSAEECRALVDECSPVLRPVVEAAIHTGMRKGEILTLAWHSVDLDRAEIHVEPESEKTGRGRAIPLTDELLGVLRKLKVARPRPALDGSDPVFSDAAGTPFTTSSLRRMFEPTVSRCESIPLAKRNSLRFHDLRHTAASLMVAAGVPIFDVAKLLGHSTPTVTMRYAHFAPEAGRSAAQRLGHALAKAQRPVARSG